MTMLMHTGSSFKPVRHSPDGQATAGTVAAHAHLAMIKRFCISTLTVLAVGGAVTAIVAFKAALSVWVYHYY
jgi:tetrahydromethanopterin S-methyltransferase subunit E